MKIMNYLIMATGLLITIFFSLNAQEGPPIIDHEERAQVIDGISEVLREQYIFPNVADDMANLINSRQEKGWYDGITDPVAFSQKITDELVSISKDLQTLRKG